MSVAIGLFTSNQWVAGMKATKTAWSKNIKMFSV